MPHQASRTQRLAGASGKDRSEALGRRESRSSSSTGEEEQHARNADQQYQYSVYRDLVVGDEFIELELHTRLDRDDSLIVEQRMINHSGDPVDFKCLLYAPGRRRQQMQVFRLSNSYDVKKYLYPNARDLIGSELWLRAEELGGTRVLNHRVTVER